MKKVRKLVCLILLTVIISALLISCVPVKKEKVFTWENATVYFLLTDRFFNGNTANDHSYGRGLNADNSVNMDRTEGPGGFHGGDFAGVTAKIKEGYFTDLGVDAIWVSPPFEQIHGFRSGPGFAFYAYHGYWTLDFTEPDANYGTEEEFAEMVDAAHAKGIRIILDVILNHPGYATPEDAEAFDFGEYEKGWDTYKEGPDSSLSGDTEAAFAVEESASWQEWWGPDWIRVDNGLAGYDSDGTTDELSCLSGLPDFKTESSEEVELPVFLAEKWEAEGRLAEELKELDTFFAQTGLPRTVLNYEIKWLTDWVRDYGVDGFRCDTAKHVETTCWASLGEQADLALKEWRASNSSKAIGSEPFWTVGEVWDHGIVKDAYYTDTGFDALINFSFRKNLMNVSLLPKLYTFMAETMATEDINALSYISSHDTALFTRSKLKEGMTSLLLAPGAVQIFYGDETSRKRAWEDCEYTDLTMRSAMNWETVDEELLSFVQCLGQFRFRHPAIGAGQHREISQDPYMFARTWEDGDRTDEIIAVITDPDVSVVIPVTGVFQEGERLVNACDGSAAVVKDGSVSFSSGPDGVILIEKEEAT